MARLPKWVTVDYLRELRRMAEEHPSRQLYIRNLQRYYAHYRGSALLAPINDLGDDMEIDTRHAAARRNVIKREVDKVSSIFLKNTPIVRRHPFYPEDSDLSDDLDALYLQAWEDSCAQDVVRSMLLEAAICGLSIGKIYWNAMDRSVDRNGSVGIEKLAPGSVLVDPWARNDHRGLDAGFIFHTTEQPVAAVLNKYGRKASEALHLQPGGYKKSIGQRVKEIAENVLSTGSIAGDAENKPRKGYVKVVEVWLFPQSMHSSSLTTGENIPDDEYPYGLVVTLINDEIVRFMPNPFVTTKTAERYDKNGIPTRKRVKVGHKRHPFIPLYWSRIGSDDGKGKNNFYDCMGMVEGMIPMQVNINALRRNIAITARTLATPCAVVQEDALAAPLESLTWTPSQILRIQQGYTARDAIQILEGAQMPQYVIDMVQSDVAEIGRDAGLEPGVIGLFPQGGGTSHTPGITIGSLQEAAFGSLWAHVQELGAALLDMSVLYDGLIQQFYKPDRYMTVTRNGKERHVEFSDRHVTANFRRQVVAGATTPMFDIEKQQRISGVVEIVNNAILSQNPTIMEVAIEHLEALRFPWAHDFKQILEKAHQEALAIQQGTQVLRKMALTLEGSQLMQGGEQQAAPAGTTQEDDMLSVINQVAEIEGVSPEEVAIRMAEQ